MGKHIVAVGNGMVEYLVSYFHVSRKRISVICNGTDITEASHDDIDRLRTTLGLSSKKKILLSVGRLDKNKGLDVLLKAFCQISKAYPQVHLLIVGTGSETSVLQSLAENLKIEQKVTFCGFHEYLAPFYGLADIFVHPSFKEGLSGSAIEAGMLGLPMVASDIAGLQETVIPNYSGYLVPPGDIDELSKKILILLNDSELCKKMGERSRKFVKKNFSQQVMYDGYDRYYRLLMNRD